MKLLKKGSIFFLLILLVLFGNLSFYTDENSQFQKKAVNQGKKETMEEFTIAGFVNYYDFKFKSLEEQTKELAESGINWIDTPLWYVNDPDQSSYTGRRNPYITKDGGWEEFNELCKELNIYFSIQEQDGNTPTISSVETLVNEAKDLDRCIGYYVKDEPSSAQLNNIAEVFNKLNALDSTRFPYVNLYPNYAGASNLGGSYEDYVNQWVNTAGANNIEYLYFDHYPFTASESVRASYFSDVETIRKVAFENGKIKTGGYTQMGWWNGMRRPSIDEARWNINSLLAYGIKGLIHFNWVAPKYVSPEDGGEGMQDFVLSNQGLKTDLYEPMQKLNWQTRQLGPILMNIDVAHAYHTGNIPMGTEELPKNFLLQPSSSSDNLILSLCYAKNSDDKYLMIFNKELEETKNYVLDVDQASGLESLTWYKPDTFDTLPNYKEALALPTEENIDLSSGKFEVELNPGEMRLYKMNGDIVIKEPLKAPKVSHKSGTYLGEQYVTLSTNDIGAEIYYTTDGSYPDYSSKRYTEPIKVGNDRNFGVYSIKAIALRGKEISEVSTREYIISDGSENVALGKPVSFTGETECLDGIQKPESITDGFFDPFNIWGSINNSPCFAIVDLQKEYNLDKLVVKMFHDWPFDDVIVQTALDKDFTQGVYTVFNNDTDNSVGVGVGTDGNYVENPNGGHTFSFPTTKARYIRVTNLSNRIDNYKRSMFEEIQAYTAYDAGTELLGTSDWKVTGGGTWEYSDSVLKQTDTYDTNEWNRSYTYTGKTYKNFILEGKIKMNVTDPSSWGYVGFGLYKPKVDYTQADYDKGFYAVMEPRGRVLLWNGKKPELGPEDANVVGYSLGSEYVFRVVSIDDVISISVNGQPVMYVRNEILNREAGYISIHSGLIPMEISSLKITELDSSVKPIENEETIKSVEEVKTYVPRYAGIDTVYEKLPSKVSVVDTKGDEYLVDVDWKCSDYDSSKTGYTLFEGTLKSLPNGLINKYNYKSIANVFIQPEVDKSKLEGLVELALSIDENNYTQESYEGLRIKLEAAQAILEDPYLVQSDIGVGNFQLFDAIYKYLVSTVDKSELRKSIEKAKNALETNDYTEGAKTLLQTAIDKAQEEKDNILSNASEVEQATEELNNQVKRLTQKQVIVEQNVQPQIKHNTYKHYNEIVFILIGLGFGIALSVILFIKQK